jgi:hypothetical protein
VEQQLSAGLTERQIAQLVDDDEIVAQQLLGQPAAATKWIPIWKSCPLFRCAR